MITSWHSYPKVWSLGHSAISELLADPVVVEEKIDGSQFSFGIFNGEIKCRSKGQQIIVDAPEKMFSKAVESVIEIAPLLHDGWTYRAEYLQKPKHNIHAYSRIPNKHLILFDINTGEESYLSHAEKAHEAGRIGLEYVPCFFYGKIENIEQFYALLEHESILGGQKIEGVVIKNYAKFTPDKKAMLGKYVSESFKEKHKKEWGELNPKQGDIITIITHKFKSEVRWQKAIQHLRENGTLENSPRDIGNLIKEVKSDTKIECKDEIMQDLFKWAWPQIERSMTVGLPEWYKQHLAEKQFENGKSHALE